ncbi:hypothetical protein [Haloferula sp. A504]|uniref:hypothetical protein n=1 Tax=Haloferula sp. A504 TaxID=3373601 RepID=UPI0031C6B69C|nr:hypothetical protein [Verrucomicrobiaceae bacterium E54]
MKFVALIATATIGVLTAAEKPNVVFIMADDPREQTDLAGKHPDKVAAMKKELDRIRDSSRSRR